MFNSIKLLKISALMFASCLSLKAAESTPDTVIVTITDKNGRKTNIYRSQVQKVFLSRIKDPRINLKDNKALTALVQMVLEQLIEGSILWSVNKDKLLKDETFLRELMGLTYLLMEDRELSKVNSTLTESDFKAEYQKEISKLSTPMQFKIQAAVYDSVEKAQSAIKAVEGGEDFGQIVKSSTSNHLKKYKDGFITDPNTKSSFIYLFNAALPMGIMAKLEKTTTAGLISEPISIIDETGATKYWVVKVIQIKEGSKNDFPKFDSKDQFFKAQVVMNKIKQTVKTLAKDFKIEMIKPKNAKGDTVESKNVKSAIVESKPTNKVVNKTASAA